MTLPPRATAAKPTQLPRAILPARPRNFIPGARACIVAGTWALLSLALCGCGATHLEDGYKIRALDATPEVRRAYYASPFTDEAAAAKRPRGETAPARRPGQY